MKKKKELKEGVTAETYYSTAGGYINCDILV
jgi:hypothetical protein